jgi:hypothetical protein
VVFANIGSMDLLLGNCSCGNITILGFYQQLEWDQPDLESMTVSALWKCRRCGSWHTRRERIRQGKHEVFMGEGI